MPVRRRGSLYAFVGALGGLFVTGGLYALSRLTDARTGLWLASGAAVALIGALVGRRLYRLHRATQLDPGTGIYNRRFFYQRLIHEVQLAGRTRRPLSLVFIDVDDFKRVNDRYGHLVGDQVLRLVARSLYRGIREEDVVARWGGEEFALLLPDTGQEEASVVAERVRRLVANGCTRCSEGEITVTISLGVATYPRCGRTASDLVRMADRALYSAKAHKNEVALAK